MVFQSFDLFCVEITIFIINTQKWNYHIFVNGAITKQLKLIAVVVRSVLNMI
jgi:hypothetical protein